MNKSTWELPESEKNIVRKMLIDLGYGEDMPLKEVLKIAIDNKENNVIKIIMKYV